MTNITRDLDDADSEEQLDFTPVFLELHTGVQLMTFLSMHDEGVYHLYRPIEIRKSISPATGKIQLIVKQWIEFSDQEMFHVHASDVVVVAALNERFFEMYGEHAKTIYLSDDKASVQNEDEGLSNRVDRDAVSINESQTPCFDSAEALKSFQKQIVIDKKLH